MTSVFRINAIRLDTSRGPVEYEFRSDLTVLAGPPGVGKTTLLELMKYALGGDAILTSVATDYVTSVHLDVRAGTRRLRLSRSLRGLGADPNTVRVVDLDEGHSLPEHFVASRTPLLSDLLMTSLDLPVGLVAASRTGKSTRKGARVTFNDVFRYMYVSQLSINQDIAGSSDDYYAPKRKLVFEILFDLTSEELPRKRSELAVLNHDADRAKADVNAVTQFLASSRTKSREEADRQWDVIQREADEANIELQRLTTLIYDATDRETQVLRDLLTSREMGLAEAQRAADDLRSELAHGATERQRLQQEITRLDRIESAGLLLATIEFNTCPRCTQSLDREVPPGTCRVCLQDDVVAALPQRGGDQERTQLVAEIGELDHRQEQLDSAFARTRELIVERQQLVRELSRRIDERTRTRVTPRLQAYADATRKVERRQTEGPALEAVRRQWDRLSDLNQYAESLEERRQVLRGDIKTLEAEDKARRGPLMTRLSAEFQRTVEEFRIPNGQRATINDTTYLPELNGRSLETIRNGGGTTTAIQVAYWLSLLTVASGEETFNPYPTFLLIDSPRLALNTATEMTRQMYRRMVNQANAAPGRFQFIVADNELPADYKAGFDEIRFDFNRPTVRTVHHPGPEFVTIIGKETARDD